MSARVVRVGDLGTALTAMCPSGVVELARGDRLDARSDGAPIPAGAAVVVLRGDPTGYVVREVGPGHPFPALPDDGAEIVRPAFMRNSAEVRLAEAADEAELRRKWERSAGARVVYTAGLGMVIGFWDTTLAHDIGLEWYAVGAAVGLVTGAAIAFAVGRAGRLIRWSPFAGLVAVGGGLLGAELGFWASGWTDLPLAVGVAGGALVGTVAGGWVGRNVDVLGGPDAPA